MNYTYLADFDKRIDLISKYNNNALIKGIATYFIGRWGGKNGAYDKLALKSLLGKEFVRDCFSYGIAKGLLSAAMPGFWRSVFTLTSFYLGDTITKMLLVSSLASGARWLIDQIFG